MNYNKMYTQLFSNANYSKHGYTEPRYIFANENIDRFSANNIIDIGSGRGVLLELIKKTHPNIRLVSTDLQKFHNIDCEFINLDLTNKNTYFYPAQKFDLLMCLDVLEHLDKCYITQVFEWFAEISKYQVLSIANHSEIINGIELHTIQENIDYWISLINKKSNVLSRKELVFISQPDEMPNIKIPHYLYILTTESKNYEK